MLIFKGKIFSDHARKEELSEWARFTKLVRQAAEEAVDERGKEEDDLCLAINEKSFCASVLSDDLDWEIGGTIPQAEDIISSMVQLMMIDKVTTEPWGIR